MTTNIETHRAIAAQLVRARDSYTEAVRQFTRVSDELQRFAGAGRGAHYATNAATVGLTVETTATKYRTLLETAELVELSEDVLATITGGANVLDVWRLLAANNDEAAPEA